MAPFLPRIQFIEILDQEWLPRFFVSRFQEIISLAWQSDATFRGSPPSRYAATVLLSQLGDSLPDYIFADMCAGGGEPMPAIAGAVNQTLRARGSPTTKVVLSDLYPNVPAWERAAQSNPDLTYEHRSIDARYVPADYAGAKLAGDRKVFRMFNDAFHHFDDDTALSVLRDTVETGGGMAVLELQGRGFLSHIGILLLVVFVLVFTPVYAWTRRSPAILLFTYLIPIIPAVLVWDGIVSGLRTRTPDETEALLRTCGAKGAQDWVVSSGEETFFWPVGKLRWTICKPGEKVNGSIQK